MQKCTRAKHKGQSKDIPDQNSKSKKQKNKKQKTKKKARVIVFAVKRSKWNGDQTSETI